MRELVWSVSKLLPLAAICHLIRKYLEKRGHEIRRDVSSWLITFQLLYFLPINWADRWTPGVFGAANNPCCSFFFPPLSFNVHSEVSLLKRPFSNSFAPQLSFHQFRLYFPISRSCALPNCLLAACCSCECHTNWGWPGLVCAQRLHPIQFVTMELLKKGYYLSGALFVLTCLIFFYQQMINNLQLFHPDVSRLNWIGFFTVVERFQTGPTAIFELSCIVYNLVFVAVQSLVVGHLCGCPYNKKSITFVAIFTMWVFGCFSLKVSHTLISTHFQLHVLVYRLGGNSNCFYTVQPEIISSYWNLLSDQPSPNDSASDRHLFQRTDSKLISKKLILKLNSTLKLF